MFDYTNAKIPFKINLSFSFLLFFSKKGKVLCCWYANDETRHKTKNVLIKLTYF